MLSARKIGFGLERQPARRPTEAKQDAARMYIYNMPEVAISRRLYSVMFSLSNDFSAQSRCALRYVLLHTSSTKKLVITRGSALRSGRLTRDVVTTPSHTTEESADDGYRLGSTHSAKVMGEDSSTRVECTQLTTLEPLVFSLSFRSCVPEITAAMSSGTHWRDARAGSGDRILDAETWASEAWTQSTSSVASSEGAARVAGSESQAIRRQGQGECGSSRRD